MPRSFMVPIADQELADSGGRAWADWYREPEDSVRFSGSFWQCLGIPPPLSMDDEDQLEATAGDSGRLDSRSDGGYSSGPVSRVRPATGNGASAPPPLPSLARGLSDAGPSVERTRFADGDKAVRSSKLDDEQPLEKASPLQPRPAVWTGLSKSDTRELSPVLEYLSTLAHLAVFGMLGVLIRFGLQTLFGPKVADVTGKESALFIDLPANMVGSFFMGWVGVTLKAHISSYSEILAVGLSTGLMGSITTFASWNQHMLELLTGGRWVHAFVGILIGMQLSWMCLIFGMDSSRALLALIQCWRRKTPEKDVRKLQRSAEDHPARTWIFFVSFSLLGGGMWVASTLLTLLHVDQRQLWMACIVAPFGVWTRWQLARLNGQGVGPEHWIKWFPVGTLLANVIASWLEASLGTAQVVAASGYASLLTGALQLGLMGCMSTVSTVVVEVHTMHQGDRPWRAYAYFVSSIACSLLPCILIYSVPLWSLDLVSRQKQ